MKCCDGKCAVGKHFQQYLGFYATVLRCDDSGAIERDIGYNVLGESQEMQMRCLPAPNNSLWNRYWTSQQKMQKPTVEWTGSLHGWWLLLLDDFTYIQFGVPRLLSRNALLLGPPIHIFSLKIMRSRIAKKWNYQESVTASEPVLFNWRVLCPVSQSDLLTW